MSSIFLSVPFILTPPITNLPTFGQFGLVSLVTFAAWYILTSIQSWHRLRAFPAASPLAHFSYLWLARTTWSGQQYWVHRDLHRKHGGSPLVRIGPNELMTNDPVILKGISAARSGFARDAWYEQGKFNPYIDNMFSVLGEKEHTKYKSRTIAAYSGRETPDLEVGVDSQVRTLLDLLRAKYANKKDAGTAADAPLLDLGRASTYFTLDVITRLAFGHAMGYLAKETDHFDFLATVHSLWPQMSTSADVPWIRNILFSVPFLKLLGPKVGDKKGFGALMGVAEHHISKRYTPGAKVQQDMVGSMIKRGLTQAECEGEGLFMIMAGTESTASAIRHILVHVMTCPPVYAKLKAEIAEAVAAGRVSSPVISLEEAKSLPYLQAVIYEGLRMRPPLLGLLPKLVPAGGAPALLPGVPGGTAICMNMSAMLRSETLFGPDADVFRPERFMEHETPEQRREMELNTEMLFGSGQWMCVGRTVAFLELNKSVFELFRSFDLQLMEPNRPCDIASYGTFLEFNMLVKVTESGA